jgi:hypothetical protein
MPLDSPWHCLSNEYSHVYVIFGRFTETGLLVKRAFVGPRPTLSLIRMSLGWLVGASQSGMSPVYNVGVSRCSDSEHTPTCECTESNCSHVCLCIYICAPYVAYSQW